MPQGSVHGPVLFIAFINDVSDYLTQGCKMKLYADDAKVYTVLDDVFSPASLQLSLDAIFAWSSHWQLVLAGSKCSVMHMFCARTQSRQQDYFICNRKLPSVTSFTDLGVSYDNKFRFTAHVDRVAQRASLRSKLILKCFSSRSPAILKLAFCTFVRPLLEFSSGTSYGNAKNWY